MKKTVSQIVRDEIKKAKLIGLPAKVNTLSKKVDEISGKMDRVNDAARIIQENEQNLRDLGGLKHKLDVLDSIYEKVDKIAGEITTYRGQQEMNSTKLTDHGDRIDKIEKHLHLQAP